MEILNYKIPIVVKTTTSERAELIKLFISRLNLERGKYKPLTTRAVAVKLSHVKTSELYYFYKKCEQSNNFSKCFWGCLKIK